MVADFSGVKVSLGLQKLQKSVFDALGWTARGLKRNADAEAYVARKNAETEVAIALIKAKGEYELAEFIESKERSKFANIQAVYRSAEKELQSEESVSEKEVKRDWLNRFLSIVECISEAQAQELWGKILAGEIKNPGAFSLRTLETLKNISQEEALVFQRLSSLIFLPQRDAIFDKDISVDDIVRLSDAGLVHPEKLIKILEFPESQQETRLAVTRSQFLTFYTKLPTPRKINIPFYQLTKSGKELVALLPCVDDCAYVDTLCKVVQKEGVSKVTRNSIIRWEGSRYHYNPLGEVVIASFE